MISPEIEKKYADVQTVLDGALTQVKSIEVTGTDENAQLMQIHQKLETLNMDFQKEIEKLRNSSEWDKFCIAFFGETNAGKSTIIETLRIIYDEETRRTEALAKKEIYYRQLSQHTQEYEALVSSLSEVNSALKKQYGRSFRWLYYILVAFAGVGCGLLLANLGISLW